MVPFNAMKTFEIAVIPGDGIGQEVTPEGWRVLEAAGKAHGAAFRATWFDWGTEHYFRHGRMMPEDAIERLRGFDAIFLGAVGHPEVPDHVTLNGLLLPIRRAFDQYACVRPARLYPGVRAPLAGLDPDAADLVVIRENTEGEYAQAGGRIYAHQPSEVALQTAVFTRRGVERIIRFAFEYARRPDRRKRLASITKSNAQGHSMTLWDETFRQVAAEYPDVETESLLVDAATVHFVRRLPSFDVVVGSNLFGDILSDLSAALTGSLGLAASANLDPSRRYPSMFEPVHGSAPDIAGSGKANPAAMILSAALMLDWLGLEDAAKGVERAVAGTLAEAANLTPDLGGTAKTQEITEAALAKFGSAKP